MSEIQLCYTYPDGLGTGGTYTDGDQFSEDSIQTIVDGVVAHTRSDEQSRIIKLLRERARHLMQVSESISMDDYMSDEDAAVPENGAFALNEFADALIKGENK